MIKNVHKSLGFLNHTSYACGIKSKHICFAAKSTLTCVQIFWIESVPVGPVPDRMENELHTTEQAEVSINISVLLLEKNSYDVFISYTDNEILCFPMALSNV